MADFVGSPASFWVQSNALLRKNLTFQKRRICANITLVLIPAFFCMFCFAIQMATDYYAVKNTIKNCDPALQAADPFNPTLYCPIPSPIEWPPVLEIPPENYRAVRTDSFPSWTDLPDPKDMPRPVTILITGSNQTLALSGLGSNLFPVGGIPNNSTSNVTDFSKVVMGTGFDATSFGRGALTTLYSDEGISWVSAPFYNLQKECDVSHKGEDDSTEEDKGKADSATQEKVEEDDYYKNMNKTELELSPNKTTIPKHVDCLPTLLLLRNSSSEINDELFKGHMKGNNENKINAILTAFDISNSDSNNFNVTVWYNSTSSKTLQRVPRLVNMISNTFLQFVKGTKTKIMCDFVKEFPKGYTAPFPDVASFMGPLLFTWIVLQLFPVVLASLVYEKQERLRVMMKMHGLGDGPYWLISYVYFLTVSILYILFFVGFGTLLSLNFFYGHDFGLEFTFYFVVVNLQIALAFLLSTMFSTTRSATVVAYVYVFGSGLLGSYFFQRLITDKHMPKAWIILLELYPGFSLYRGLFEFANYASEGKIMHTGRGMNWDDLNDSLNGMKDVLIIMALEWAVLLLLAFFIDQVVTWGKSPLRYLRSLRKQTPILGTSSMQRVGSKGVGDMDKPDVAKETEKVDKLMEEAKYTSHVVICDKLKKVYPGRDGNPEKIAVRGLSLALPQGECFGMLGPSGAGKTSLIEMMIGLTKPTTGTAYVQGLDLVTQMNEIYSCIGVCPQHDLLWATLTGREHLLFYGRLKNLKGSTLTRAVEDSLKSLNLFNGGVADKRAGQYSGGMKRRLSVAISLIGNPIAVYMDEPSTGLDPASRNTLWNVIKLAKQGRVIILTTHSMEEAEFLCDRIGIFVDGRIQCLGNPKELKGRYGGTYVFTITTDSCHEQEVESLIHRLAPNAIRVYHLAGTQKFEFAKTEVRIADVFQTVEHAKKMFTVYAWGIADTTLEDVFIKVASAPKKQLASDVVLSRENLVE